MEELLYKLINGLLIFVGSVFALFVVYIFLSIPFENIRYNWKFSGGYHPPAFSKSIEESKKRNVFIGFLEMDIEYVDSLKNDVQLSEKYGSKSLELFCFIQNPYIGLDTVYILNPSKKITNNVESIYS